jgi:SAM-dependent methyltransferase
MALPVVHAWGMVRDVTPDGSPVPVYAALPAQPEFTPVLQFVVPPASVLDLGCGVGRLSNELALGGLDVTGVDESQDMLDRLRPEVHAVRADIKGLGLGRRFDYVVLASHLVNVADEETRLGFLRAAAEHVEDSGAVLVQHWEPWPARPSDSDASVGAVGISFRVLALNDGVVDGRVVYSLGRRRWEQTFRAVLFDEAGLDAQLAKARLRRIRRLAPKWLVARAAAAR